MESLRRGVRVYHIGLCAVFALFLGSVAVAQDVTLSPASISWGGVQVGQISAAKSFTVTNNQSVPLTISSLSIPAGADFVVSASSCPIGPVTLAASGSCTVSVQFRPLAQGSRTNSVNLVDDAPSHTQSLPLSGTASIGAVLYSPTLISFDNVAVGTTSAPQSVNLTNELSNAITLTNIKISSGPFTQTNNCPLSPSTLAAGATCTFSVDYQPTAEGSSSGLIIATYNTGTVTTNNQLYVSGSTPPTNVILAPASYDFGSVQVGLPSAVQSLTLTNNYSQAVAISSISASLTDYTIASNCPSTLAAGANCNLNVTFTPSSAGARQATLTVSHNAPGLPATASLTGTGTAVPTGIVFSPTSLSWGGVQIGQTASTKAVMMTNSTGAALSVSSIGVGSDYSVTSTTCPLSPNTIAVGTSCTISVTFRPMAQGVRSDTIKVADNGPGSPQQVPLSGTGLVGPALFSPTSLSFPSTAVGSTSGIQTATLTNEQATPLNIVSLVASGNFAQTSDCPATLAPNASCTLSVTFAPPSTPGAKTGLVTLNYGSGVLSLFVSGTATGGSLVGLTPKIKAFGDEALGTTSAPFNVTVTNYETVALNFSSITVGAPFSETNNCGTILAPAQTCTITVTFTPTAVGYFTSNVVISDDAAGSPQTIAVAGNAVVPVSTLPKVGGLYFYHQVVLTPSTPLPVTLTNNQSIPLTISSMKSTADFPFTTDCVTSGGTGTLAVGATCTVQITFLPAVLGDRSAALTVVESAVGSPLIIPLAGTGIVGDPGPTVTVGPYAPCLLPSQTMQFSAIVTGTTNQAVQWYVDNTLNGKVSSGTITTTGLYTAPPTTGSHVIKAVSQANTKISGSSTISLTQTPNFTIYPYVASIPTGGQQTYQAQLCGVPDAGSVSYTVATYPGGNPVLGGNATVGTVTPNGVYTAPSVAGKFIVRVTDGAVNKGSGAVVNVFSSISADFGSRMVTTHPIPADMFGTGRGESMHTTADRSLLTEAGLTVPRLYAQIPLVYKTQTPDWTRIDPLISSIQAAGQHAMLQMSLTPPWLQPSPNPCGAGNDLVVPNDVNQWAQIAASYVHHMDTTFPGVVQDYEIWNEPNGTGLCSTNHLNSYLAIYAAAAPAMKNQAAMDGKTIRVGGPVLSGYNSQWITALITNTTTAPYVDFISYHQYLFGAPGLQVKWDSYNGNISMYQALQDPNTGPAAIFAKTLALVQAGKPGANTPIYVTEFNSNWSFYKDCCRDDATYAPLWNSLYVTYLLNTVYTGSAAVPGKLIYFAGSAYPWFCMVGVHDANMDCLYSAGSTPEAYPQYYTYQLIAGSNYLGLSGGGYMAKSVSPASGGGGLATTAFYTATQDAIVITNPTSTAYSQISVSFQNPGFTSPQATLYQIVDGAMINSVVGIPLSSQGSGFTATINIPPYSVQAISLKAQ